MNSSIRARHQQIRQRQEQTRKLTFGLIVIGVLGIASYLLVGAFFKPGPPPPGGKRYRCRGRNGWLRSI